MSHEGLVLKPVWPVASFTHGKCIFRVLSSYEHALSTESLREVCKNSNVCLSIFRKSELEKSIVDFRELKERFPFSYVSP